MPSYFVPVGMCEYRAYTLRIEADSVEEAVKKAWNGEGEESFEQVLDRYVSDIYTDEIEFED